MFIKRPCSVVTSSVLMPCLFLLMLTCGVILHVDARATDGSALMYFGCWRVNTLLHSLAPFWTEAKLREASLDERNQWIEHVNYKG